jgi:hypothetical protein
LGDWRLHHRGEHVSGAVCLERRNLHRVVNLRSARSPDRAGAAAAHASTAAQSTPPTRGDPDSSSIAGRRASGFLQVSLSKVSRHEHRGARPASSAETPPMNANDFRGVIPTTILGGTLEPTSLCQPWELTERFGV